MKYQKLGEDLEIPARNGFPLSETKSIKFNYYLSSRINGKLIDLDITSKLFDKDKMYIRKSCYRVNLGDMENCVKANTIDHMLQLGLKVCNIPASLKNINFTNTNLKLSNKGAFSD